MSQGLLNTFRRKSKYVIISETRLVSAECGMDKEDETKILCINCGVSTETSHYTVYTYLTHFCHHMTNYT